jgi:hypothetical protein
MWFSVNYIQDLRRFIEVYTSSFFAIIPPTIDQQILPKILILFYFYKNGSTTPLSILWKFDIQVYEYRFTSLFRIFGGNLVE